MKFRTFLAAAVLATAVVVPAASGTAAAAPTHAGYTGPCHAAVDAYWPAGLQAWAHRIVHRESRGVPTAANRRSSARGCFQMLLRYSSPFYRAAGCSNAQWANATCNVRAAYAMYRKAGARPWRTY